MPNLSDEQRLVRWIAKVKAQGRRAFLSDRLLVAALEATPRKKWHTLQVLEQHTVLGATIACKWEAPE